MTTLHITPLLHAATEGNFTKHREACQQLAQVAYIDRSRSSEHAPSEKAIVAMNEIEQNLNTVLPLFFRERMNPFCDLMHALWTRQEEALVNINEFRPLIERAHTFAEKHFKEGLEACLNDTPLSPIIQIFSAELENKPRTPSGKLHKRFKSETLFVSAFTILSTIQAPKKEVPNWNFTVIKTRRRKQRLMAAPPLLATGEVHTSSRAFVLRNTPRNLAVGYIFTALAKEGAGHIIELIRTLPSQRLERTTTKIALMKLLYSTTNADMLMRKLNAARLPLIESLTQAIEERVRDSAHPTLPLQERFFPQRGDDVITLPKQLYREPAPTFFFSPLHTNIKAHGFLSIEEFSSLLAAPPQKMRAFRRENKAAQREFTVLIIKYEVRWILQEIAFLLNDGIEMTPGIGTALIDAINDYSDYHRSAIATRPPLHRLARTMKREGENAFVDNVLLEYNRLTGTEEPLDSVRTDREYSAFIYALISVTIAALQREGICLQTPSEPMQNLGMFRCDLIGNLLRQEGVVPLYESPFYAIHRHFALLKDSEETRALVLYFALLVGIGRRTVHRETMLSLRKLFEENRSDESSVGASKQILATLMELTSLFTSLDQITAPFNHTLSQRTKHCSQFLLENKAHLLALFESEPSLSELITEGSGALLITDFPQGAAEAGDFFTAKNALLSRLYAQRRNLCRGKRHETSQALDESLLRLTQNGLIQGVAIHELQAVSEDKHKTFRVNLLTDRVRLAKKYFIMNSIDGVDEPFHNLFFFLETAERKGVDNRALQTTIQEHLRYIDAMFVDTLPNMRCSELFHQTYAYIAGEPFPEHPRRVIKVKTAQIAIYSAIIECIALTPHSVEIHGSISLANKNEALPDWIDKDELSLGRFNARNTALYEFYERADLTIQLYQSCLEQGTVHTILPKAQPMQRVKVQKKPEVAAHFDPYRTYVTFPETTSGYLCSNVFRHLIQHNDESMRRIREHIADRPCEGSSERILRKELLTESLYDLGTRTYKEQQEILFQHKEPTFRLLIEEYEKEIQEGLHAVQALFDTIGIEHVSPRRLHQYLDSAAITTEAREEKS